MPELYELEEDDDDLLDDEFCMKSSLRQTQLPAPKHRPSSGNNSTFWTTNSGAPVWNNNSALTVGQRGDDFLKKMFRLQTWAAETDF